MKIIDRLLSLPLSERLPTDALRAMYEIMIGIVDYVEINTENYRKLADVLVKDRTILRIRHADLMVDYPGFHSYVCPYLRIADKECLVVEISLPTTSWQELRNLRKRTDHVRLTGLDDLLQDDWSAMFDFLLDLGGVELCPGNRLSSATAIAYEWLVAGGGAASASFLGEGGFAPLEHLLMALHLRQHAVDSVHFHSLARLRDIYEQGANTCVPEHYPVLGRDIFAVESGVHVDGIRKNPANYEPFSPGLVQATRIVRTGKHSGLSAIEMKLEEYDIPLDPQNKRALLQSIHRNSDRLGRGLKEDEFFALATQYAAAAQPRD
jgi:homocitrate synthase NifV